MPRSRSLSALCTASALTTLCAASPVGGQLRIVTYNTATAQADNPATGQSARPGVAAVLQAIGAESVGGIAKPIDVLLLQEQFSMQATTQSFVNVLNAIYGAGKYARGSLNGATSAFDGDAGRPGLIYNTQTVALIEEVALGNVGDGDGDPEPAQQPRATLRYRLRPVGYDVSADFYVYNSHYKADTGTSNNNRRLAEAQSIRANADALGQGTSIIYAGDYNIQTSNSAAYQHLLSNGAGQAFDPIATPGTWHRDGDNTATEYKIVHTQAPATTSQYPGQTLGGLDDRFDFQLVTDELRDDEGMSYLAGSYRAFGNNGTHICCNSPITSGTGAAPNVLVALMQASDHLPVVADYQLPAALGLDVSAFPATAPLGALISLDVLVSNIAPAVSARGADELEYTLAANGSLIGDATGVDAALGGGNHHQVRLDTSSLGMKSGVITISSSSPQAANSLISIPVAFEVVAGYLAADFNEDGAVDDFDLARWSSNFGVPINASKGQGDANLDGAIDGADFLAWQQQAGKTPPAAITSAVVPEPAATLTSLTALATISRLERGRRRVRRG